MALLVGKQHVYRIDKKGRLSVPKSFRDVFEAEGFRGVYAFPSFKFPAIEVCGLALMKRLEASLDHLAMFSDDRDDLAAVVLNNAEALPFDPEGRIVLPAEFLAHAGIIGPALFVGAGARCQVWEPDAFAARNRAAFDRARARGAVLPMLKPGDGTEES
ncbi:MAG: division/cell wall cluster transcriptional repressor MraZ [Alphaproteobacteria bacterium]|nr:division/cell wall cluster transcriptional repressor MraZ [Alphaproteobacteria bacterium]